MQQGSKPIKSQENQNEEGEKREVAGSGSEMFGEEEASLKKKKKKKKCRNIRLEAGGHQNNC